MGLYDDTIVGEHEHTCNGEIFVVELELDIDRTQQPMVASGTVTFTTPDDETIVCSVDIHKEAGSL